MYASCRAMAWCGLTVPDALRGLGSGQDAFGDQLREHGFEVGVPRSA